MSKKKIEPKIMVGRKDYSVTNLEELEAKTFGELVDYIDSLITTYGRNARFEFEEEAYEGYNGGVNIIYTEEESDREYNARMKRELKKKEYDALKKKQKKEKEYEEYLNLKKKFEKKEK